MARWSEILNQVHQGTNIDFLRVQYLKELSNYTKRNTIVYYSGWLHNKTINVEINDNDMIGFMETVKGLDCSKGLDLILHTPGGHPTATEAIVTYLHNKFQNIRVIVPHLAMSAGTMLACSANTVIMGKHSSLGPIDLQFEGISAYYMREEFLEAKKDLENNDRSYDYWHIILSKYPAAFFLQVLDAIKLSSKLVKEWLKKYMFCDEDKKNGS